MRLIERGHAESSGCMSVPVALTIIQRRSSKPRAVDASGSGRSENAAFLRQAFDAHKWQILSLWLVLTTQRQHSLEKPGPSRKKKETKHRWSRYLSHQRLPTDKATSLL